jgi:hypothetical protein
MDYIGAIRSAQRVDRMALLIRANACRNTARLTCYTDAQRLSIITTAETLATSVENCESLHLARMLCKREGYL